jgi:hypothetical protein
MLKPLRPHTNVRKCTDIKVTGQRCGSPALRGEFFCYFHTRVIKGVQQRVDMQLRSMALPEDCASIQLSIMRVVDGLIKGTLDPTRARLSFKPCGSPRGTQKTSASTTSITGPASNRGGAKPPDYVRQYLIEHPEFGPPSEPRSAGAPAREAATTAVQRETQAEPPAAKQNATQKSTTTDPAEERRKNAAYGASHGTEAKNNPAPKERKKPRDPSSDKVENSKEFQQAEAAIPGAMGGNWRDLRAVFEFAGISEPNKEAPVTREHDR